MPPKQKPNGPKTIPSVVQLPGGIVLKGLPFKIVEYNTDGSPKTFELFPASYTGKTDCVLFADEEWIRSPIGSAIKL